MGAAHQGVPAVGGLRKCMRLVPRASRRERLFPKVIALPILSRHSQEEHCGSVLCRLGSAHLAPVDTQA